jgi:hypothetical protein
MEIYNKRTITDIERDNPNIVYIGRPSKWGNPYKLTDNDSSLKRRVIVQQYLHWLMLEPILQKAMVNELSGKDLLCWCTPRLCHGHVIRHLIETGSLMGFKYV